VLGGFNVRSFVEGLVVVTIFGVIFTVEPVVDHILTAMGL